VNGKLVWEKDLEDDFGARKTAHNWASSPVVEGDLVLLNANTAEIALDKKTANLKWSITDKIPPGSDGSFATIVVGDF
jgi:outer membrane protein assembly factor BamB